MMSDKQIKMSDVFDLPIEYAGIDFEDRAGRPVSTGSFDHDVYIRHAVNNHDRLTAENEALQEEVERLQKILELRAKDFHMLCQDIQKIEVLLGCESNGMMGVIPIYEAAQELQAEMERLRAVSEIAITDLHSCKLDIGKHEQERDQLKAQMAEIFIAEEVCSKPFRDAMAAHDAEVIERAMDHCQCNIDISDSAEDYNRCMGSYASQLRQQAKDNNS